MFKNIECDYCHGYGTGVVAGTDWVASPFVLNFGYTGHGYGSKVYACILENKKYIAVNTFADERSKKLSVRHLDYELRAFTERFTYSYYKDNVLLFARPRNYKYSYWLGEDLATVSRFDSSMYNYVHILFYSPIKGQDLRKVRIVASFVSDVVERDDMVLLYEDSYRSEDESKDALITVCSDHFKHTLNLYKSDCYIRMLTHPERFCDNQYEGFLRFDSGRSSDTDLYDRFSMIKALRLNKDVAGSVMNLIPGLIFD